MLRIRFKANYKDARPVNWPVKHPYWVSGAAADESYAIVISYADDTQYIMDNWPEAKDLEIQEVDGYTFTDRFPKPEWFDDQVVISDQPAKEVYDCTQDVLDHRRRVAFWIKWMTSDVLEGRALVHDESKLKSPEKEIFDEFTPKLKTLEFGSSEYEAALDKMSEGIKHHYKMNPHHPEHHRDGIDGMNIWDLIEMLADWMAAASVKDSRMDLDYLQKRFNLSPQLRSIIENTLYSADMETINNRVPVEFQQRMNFSQEKNKGTA